jgi:uncharacterized protein YeaO (DUF488 family)
VHHHPALREWYDHDGARLVVYRTQYRAGLEDRSDDVESHCEQADDGTVTLLYADADRSTTMQSSSWIISMVAVSED